MHVDHTLSIYAVVLQLDWIPAAGNGLARFQSQIERRGQKSALDFTVDLQRLNEPDWDSLSYSTIGLFI
jgi:hypothetical protein